MRAAFRAEIGDGGAGPDAPGRADAALEPMTAVKLWHNPCWFSFRINYLANLFNGPVYGAIEARYGLHRPDFVVIYSIGLRAGFAAKNIVASSGFPKNTISRSIQRLLRRRLIRREADAHDGRSYALHLTAEGRRVFDAEMAPMLARERALLAPLSEAERAQLSDLLARLVTAAPLRADAVAPSAACISHPPPHPECLADQSRSHPQPHPEVPRSGLEGGLQPAARSPEPSFEAALRSAPQDEVAGGTEVICDSPAAPTEKDTPTDA